MKLTFTGVYLVHVESDSEERCSIAGAKGSGVMLQTGCLTVCLMSYPSSNCFGKVKVPNWFS